MLSYSQSYCAQVIISLIAQVPVLSRICSCGSWFDGHICNIMFPRNSLFEGSKLPSAQEKSKSLVVLSTDTQKHRVRILWERLSGRVALKSNKDVNNWKPCKYRGWFCFAFMCFRTSLSATGCQRKQAQNSTGNRWRKGGGAEAGSYKHHRQRTAQHCSQELAMVTIQKSERCKRFPHPGILNWTLDWEKGEFTVRKKQFTHYTQPMWHFRPPSSRDFTGNTLADI